MKKRYECEIEIRCLSDLLVSDGDTFTSSVDLDVCYDEYGLPYIPAKRLKGLLREAAYDTNSINLLDYLGTNGDGDTSLFISDARLKNYEDLIRAIKTKKYQAQDVLDCYTVIRSQTSIKDGVAKAQSLRTMRLINKGNVFEAKIEIELNIEKEESDEEINEKINEKINETIDNQLNSSFKAIRHIGTSRTRGWGFVECKKINSSIEDIKANSNDKPTEDDSNATLSKLSYSLHLTKPLIMINGDGDRAVSEDYIEGSKMLGAFIRAYSKAHNNKKAMELIDDNFIFSNLYITKDKKSARFEPVMNSLKHAKDAYLLDDNNAYNFIYGEDNIKNVFDENKYHNTRFKSYSGKYTDADYSNNEEEEKENLFLGVDKTISYHHKRSLSKGYTVSEDSNFFQMESIAKGQVFAGYVLGNQKQLSAFKEVFNDGDEIRIGYSKTAEYGSCIFNYKEGDEENNSNDTEKISAGDYYLHLLSPLIIYNDKFMVSSDATDIRNYLPAINVDKEKSFITYKTIGGFNVTWRTIKPNLNIIDKGSVIAFTVSDENVELPKTGFIGERNTEGFGEYRIYGAKDKLSKKIIMKKTISSDKGEEEQVEDKEQNPQQEQVSILPKRLKEIEKKKLLDKLLYHVFDGTENQEIKNLKDLNSTTVATLINEFRNHNKPLYQIFSDIFNISSKEKREKVLKVFFEDTSGFKEAFSNTYLDNKSWLSKCVKEESLSTADFEEIAKKYYLELFSMQKYKIRVEKKEKNKQKDKIEKEAESNV